MALIDKVRVIKLLLFALFMMVSMVTPAQSQVDWSIKAGIGMANIIGDNMELYIYIIIFIFKMQVMGGV